MTNSITLTPGKNISYQKHHNRNEVWTIVEGNGVFVCNGVEKKVKTGDTVVVKAEDWHAIKATSKLTFIEVQTCNPLVEEDIERTEWQWSHNL